MKTWYLSGHPVHGGDWNFKEKVKKPKVSGGKKHALVLASIRKNQTGKKKKEKENVEPFDSSLRKVGRSGSTLSLCM